ncbi:ABC transporter permease [Deinococcus maricopensis]|uniref:ABC-type transporter, integral membrane subunit n=1 Tax=Deinococcus maricopensis (strain DSM 21211 / LMG 22137 / NRRL B-23946 / LB-34) TaxID=709986 RepID=E8U9E8_DEIML|nr:ABC transporter permease [Deinococcus maricopensis]ADV67687.1 ABC-type transporter, integral membrane subunit [Deinococcus maricopensis DSM 21211]
MLPFLVRRLLQLVPTFILATIILFAVVQAAPGDFLTQLSQNPKVTPERIDQLRRIYALDQPVVVQYWKWLTKFLAGDLGSSFAANRPVWDLVAPRLWNSLILVIISTVLTYVLAILIGVYSALRPYSIGDRIMTIFAYFGLGVPSFFFALLALFFLVKLKQNTGLEVPISGKTSGSLQDPSFWQNFGDVFLHALAPSIILALRGISSESRFIRGQMMEVLNQDYIRTARAKGLASNKITYKHAFRNASLPLVAGLGALLPALIGGAGFIEVVFSWPGLTPLLLDSLANQDLYVIVSTTALSTLLYIFGNLISDLLLAAVDPRIRYN